MESELTRVQSAIAIADSARLKAKSEHGVVEEALVVAGEACTKVEEENSRLTEERISLVLELGSIKDEFAAFQEKVVADREAMEAELDASGDALFNYGYGCCVFAHNICGSKPQIQDEMPNPSTQLTPDFFAKPRCPPGTSATAPALDPVAVSREDCSKNSPAAAGEETIFPTYPRASSGSGVKDVVAD